MTLIVVEATLTWKSICQQIILLESNEEKKKKNYCDLNHKEHDYRSDMKNGLNQKTKKQKNKNNDTRCWADVVENGLRTAAAIHILIHDS